MYAQLGAPQLHYTYQIFMDTPQAVRFAARMLPGVSQLPIIQMRAIAQTLLVIHILRHGAGVF